VAIPARRAEVLPRPAPPPRHRRSAAVRRLPRRRGRRIPFVLVAGLVVAAMLIVLASAQAIVAQGAFQLSDLSDRAQQLDAEADRLRLRVARLSTPDRIAAAGRRAGLASPTRVEILGDATP
jgi:cell division protein FtsL